MKKTAFFIVFLLITASALAMRAQAGLALPSTEDSGPLSRWVGSAQEAFGDALFLKAETYFHGGVVEEGHHDDSAEDLEKEGVLGKGGSTSTDWISRINQHVHTNEVMHLNKEKRVEMLPFFAMSTALDPHNVDAVLTTAFWLDREFGKTDDALEVLKTGSRDNPDAWEIEYSMGRIYFRLNEVAVSEQHFREAARRSRSVSLEEHERMDMNYRWAQALETLGRKTEALNVYQEAGRHFDEKTAPFLQGAIREKIKELSVGD